MKSRFHLVLCVPKASRIKLLEHTVFSVYFLLCFSFVGLERLPFSFECIARFHHSLQDFCWRDAFFMVGTHQDFPFSDYLEEHCASISLLHMDAFIAATSLAIALAITLATASFKPLAMSKVSLGWHDALAVIPPKTFLTTSRLPFSLN